MRDQYHEQLDAIPHTLATMADLARTAMQRATTALLEGDLHLAEQVIQDDVHLDSLQRQVEEVAFNLMARQQPVATDLRLLVTSLRIVADLERMGDLALNVARTTRRRHPSPVVPGELRDTFVAMAEVADVLAERTARMLRTRSVELAEEMEEVDDRLDDLHREVMHTLLDGSWRPCMEEAVDASLTARFYERFGDHAVSVARRVTYLVTGQRPDIPSQPLGDSAEVPSGVH